MLGRISDRWMICAQYLGQESRVKIADPAFEHSDGERTIEGDHVAGENKAFDRSDLRSGESRRHLSLRLLLP